MIFDKIISKFKNNNKVETQQQITKSDIEMMEYKETVKKINYCHDEYKKAFNSFHHNKIEIAQEKLENIIYVECQAPPAAYRLLSDIYHYNKEFSKEKKVYEDFLNKYGNDKTVNENGKKAMKESLENVNSFLETGNWEFDCLPVDPKKIQDEIRKIKTYLKTDKDKAIKDLEIILMNGTYSNTVYYTLYKHFKDKNSDKTIKICELAIEKLGLFSVDRKNRWSSYLRKEKKAFDSQ